MSVLAFTSKSICLPISDAWRAQELTLFRIVQEALANLHRHSGSPVAIIRLERDTAEVRLAIEDRGCGLPAQFRRRKKAERRFGMGMLSMRERMEQLGGRLEIASSDAGTKLSVRLPLGVNAAASARAGKG